MLNSSSSKGLINTEGTNQKWWMAKHRSAADQHVRNRFKRSLPDPETETDRDLAGLEFDDDNDLDDYFDADFEYDQAFKGKVLKRIYISKHKPVAS